MLQVIEFINTHSNWRELLSDKRFSLRFRILNILSGDYLRNYLAVGVLFQINECDRLLTGNYPDEYKIKMLKCRIDKAKKAMEDVWHI